MSFDPQTGLCLSFCDESRQKDNWNSTQRGIGLNAGGDFTSVGLGHRNIQQD